MSRASAPRRALITQTRAAGSGSLASALTALVRPPRSLSAAFVKMPLRLRGLASSLSHLPWPGAMFDSQRTGKDHGEVTRQNI